MGTPFCIVPTAQKGKETAFPCAEKGLGSAFPCPEKGLGSAFPCPEKGLGSAFPCVPTRLKFTQPLSVIAYTCSTERPPGLHGKFQSNQCVQWIFKDSWLLYHLELQLFLTHRRNILLTYSVSPCICKYSCLFRYTVDINSLLYIVALQSFLFSFIGSCHYSACASKSALNHHVRF